MSESKKKRKCVYVPLETKLKALKRLDHADNVQKVALDFGVGEVTIDDWRHNQGKIEEWNLKNVKRIICEKQLNIWTMKRRVKACFCGFHNKGQKVVL